jgi:hypothetical protein
MDSVGIFLIRTFTPRLGNSDDTARSLRRTKRHDKTSQERAARWRKRGATPMDLERTAAVAPEQLFLQTYEIDFKDALVCLELLVVAPTSDLASSRMKRTTRGAEHWESDQRRARLHWPAERCINLIRIESAKRQDGGVGELVEEQSG